MHTPSHLLLNHLCAVLLLCGIVSGHAQNRPVRRGDIGTNGPKIGTEAPDFTLKTAEDQSIQVSALWAKKPTVILTGSHTCPVFRGKVSDIERLAKEFAGRVSFLLVYTIEAHPKGSPSPYSGKEWITPKNEQEGILLPQPADQAARVKLAQACIAREKLTVPVVVDTMENTVWKAYGSAPNCAYIIGTDGKIADAQPWMEAKRLHQTLQRVLGQ